MVEKWVDNSANMKVLKWACCLVSEMVAWRVDMWDETMAVQKVV